MEYSESNGSKNILAPALSETITSPLLSRYDCITLLPLPRCFMTKEFRATVYLHKNIELLEKKND